jgi:two-component system, cell cycle response regulator
VLFLVSAMGDDGSKRVPVGLSGLPSLDSYVDSERTTTRQTETNIAAPISATTNNRPTLTVVVGLDAGRVVRLSNEETTLGRAATCDVVLTDPGVSRVHARFIHTDTGFIVEDLGSKNGTLLNERKITRQAVPYGVTIQIGPHVLLRLGLMTMAEEQLSRELYDSSMRDALTKVYNRRYLFDRLGTEIAFQVRHQTELSLLIADFDLFKTINDTYGHPGGDLVLREGTQRMLATVRTEDVVARVGGEEFAIMLRGIGGEDAAICAERIRKAIAATPILLDGKWVSVTVSLGVASVSADCKGGPTAEILFAVADRRLYLAKKQGRNCVCALDTAASLTATTMIGSAPPGLPPLPTAPELPSARPPHPTMDMDETEG